MLLLRCSLDIRALSFSINKSNKNNLHIKYFYRTNSFLFDTFRYNINWL